MTDVAAVHRFYAAVNQALRTGNPPDLADLVAPELLRTADRPPDASGTALRPTIDRLPAAFPGLQLAVEDLIAAGDQVIAVVTVAGGGYDSVLGFPVSGPAGGWSAVDRFRLDGDRIVAFGRWELDAGATSAQPLFAAPLATLPAGPAAVEINRVTLPPGARLSPLIGPGPEVLMLEAGALTVRLLGVDPQGNAAGTRHGGEVPLRPGDLTIVPTGTPFAVDNDGQVPAVLLEVALRPTAERSPENEGIDASALSPAALLPGAAVQLMAGGPIAALLNGPATVVAARLTMAPGAGIASHPVTGMELLAVDAGHHPRRGVDGRRPPDARNRGGIARRARHSGVLERRDEMGWRRGGRGGGRATNRHDVRGNQ